MVSVSHGGDYAGSRHAVPRVSVSGRCAPICEGVASLADKSGCGME
jgi:hypothetical protein